MLIFKICFCYAISKNIIFYGSPNGLRDTSKENMQLSTIGSQIAILGL